MELGLAILGIAISVFFGVVGLQTVKKRKISQKQKTGNNSVNIQSGRDTRVGKLK
jgi:hypothetical protein